MQKEEKKRFSLAFLSFPSAETGEKGVVSVKAWGCHTQKRRKATEPSCLSLSKNVKFPGVVEPKRVTDPSASRVKTGEERQVCCWVCFFFLAGVLSFCRLALFPPRRREGEDKREKNEEKVREKRRKREKKVRKGAPCWWVSPCFALSFLFLFCRFFLWVCCSGTKNVWNALLSPESIAVWECSLNQCEVYLSQE